MNPSNPINQGDTVRHSFSTKDIGTVIAIDDLREGGYTHHVKWESGSEDWYKLNVLILVSNPIMPEQESLREKIYKLLIEDQATAVQEAFIGDLQEFETDEIMHLIEQDRERAVREAKIETARSSFVQLNVENGRGEVWFKVFNNAGQEIAGTKEAYINQLTQERSK